VSSSSQAARSGKRTEPLCVPKTLSAGEDPDYEGNGFIAAIQKNMKGDEAAVLARLRDERVPQMTMVIATIVTDC
jgi:hypothetical protein